MRNVRALLSTPLDVREYMHAGVFDIFFTIVVSELRIIHDY